MYLPWIMETANPQNHKHPAKKSFIKIALIFMLILQPHCNKTQDTEQLRTQTTPIYNQYKNYPVLDNKRKKNQTKLFPGNYKFIYIFQIFWNIKKTKKYIMYFVNKSIFLWFIQKYI